VTDAWVNRGSRATLGGISASWPDDGPDVVCWDEAPVPDAVCSREKHHPGRHMASLGPVWGYRIVAAWPGLHRPVKADLVDDPAVAPRDTLGAADA
jgi:hypothetical protein